MLSPLLWVVLQRWMGRHSAQQPHCRTRAAGDLFAQIRDLSTNFLTMRGSFTPVPKTTTLQADREWSLSG